MKDRKKSLIPSYQKQTLSFKIFRNKKLMISQQQLEFHVFQEHFSFVYIPEQGVALELKTSTCFSQVIYCLYDVLALSKLFIFMTNTDTTAIKSLLYILSTKSYNLEFAHTHQHKADRNTTIVFMFHLNQQILCGFTLIFAIMLC